jgi:hypothetical protein
VGMNFSLAFLFSQRKLSYTVFYECSKTTCIIKTLFFEQCSVAFVCVCFWYLINLIEHFFLAKMLVKLLKYLTIVLLLHFGRIS